MTDNECTHHWLIAAADGAPTSRGICQKCGAERDDFANSVSATLDWHRDVRMLNPLDMDTVSGRRLA